MQIFKESPVYQAMNITKTVIETFLSASLDGVYQMSLIFDIICVFYVLLSLLVTFVVERQISMLFKDNKESYLYLYLQNVI